MRLFQLSSRGSFHLTLQFINLCLQQGNSLLELFALASLSAQLRESVTQSSLCIFKLQRTLFLKLLQRLCELLTQDLLADTLFAVIMCCRACFLDQFKSASSLSSHTSQLVHATQLSILLPASTDALRLAHGLPILWFLVQQPNVPLPRTATI
ncbi:hypothetical protein MRX96_019320 [Rhipicephalus microplus]